MGAFPAPRPGKQYSCDQLYERKQPEQDVRAPLRDGLPPQGAVELREIPQLLYGYRNPQRQERQPDNA